MRNYLTEKRKLYALAYWYNVCILHKNISTG